MRKNILFFCLILCLLLVGCKNNLEKAVTNSLKEDNNHEAATIESFKNDTSSEESETENLNISIEYYIDNVNNPASIDDLEKEVVDSIISQLRLSEQIYRFEELSIIKIYKLAERKSLYVFVGDSQGDWPSNMLYSYNGKHLELIHNVSEIKIVQPEENGKIFIEVYEWSHMGNGRMDLYELIGDEVTLLLLGPVGVDMYFEQREYCDVLKGEFPENIKLEDGDIYSFVYRDGRVATKYEDVNNDTYIDFITYGYRDCYVTKANCSSRELLFSDEIKSVFLYNHYISDFEFWKEGSIKP